MDFWERLAGFWNTYDISHIFRLYISISVYHILKRPARAMINFLVTLYGSNLVKFEKCISNICPPVSVDFPTQRRALSCFPTPRYLNKRLFIYKKYIKGKKNITQTWPPYLKFTKGVVFLYTRYVSWSRFPTLYIHIFYQANDVFKFIFIEKRNWSVSFSWKALWYLGTTLNMESGEAFGLVQLAPTLRYG
jgi:hypothetical protein